MPQSAQHEGEPCRVSARGKSQGSILRRFGPHIGHLKPSPCLSEHFSCQPRDALSTGHPGPFSGRRGSRSPPLATRVCPEVLRCITISPWSFGHDSPLRLSTHREDLCEPCVNLPQEAEESV